MKYHVSYDPDGWVRTASALEWRQVVTQDLDGGMQLVVVLTCGVSGKPTVSEAHIEHRYLTRREGAKTRTVKRLNPREVVIVELATAPTR